MQSTYLLSDEQTVRREYAPLEAIQDNYDKYVVSFDEISYPSHKGIKTYSSLETGRGNLIKVTDEKAVCYMTSVSYYCHLQSAKNQTFFNIILISSIQFMEY